MLLHTFNIYSKMKEVVERKKLRVRWASEARGLASVVHGLASRAPAVRRLIVWCIEKF